MIAANWEIIAKVEPRLADLDRLVQQAVQGVADDDTRWCANSFFHSSIKPFIRHFVGWGRGYPTQEARPPGDSWKPITFDHYLNGEEDKLRRPATNEFEEMLRTPDAYDLVYERLYAHLPGCRSCSCM
ncbi:hypothetical protein [Nonomuraea sp. NPDC048901]|uniref:hypothetical protein n=1 Tax=Nonomuraea sp. NPDC048901 TaxID=3155627 RepID=UPI0033C2326C